MFETLSTLWDVEIIILDDLPEPTKSSAARAEAVGYMGTAPLGSELGYQLVNSETHCPQDLVSK